MIKDLHEHGFQRIGDSALIRLRNLPISNPPFLHTFGTLNYHDRLLALPSFLMMPSNTTSEAASWAMPAMVQDLTSLFGLESTAQDFAMDSRPSCSDTGDLHNVEPARNDNLFPIHRPDAVKEGKAKTKSKFILAHPPPITRAKQRLCTRPRMILQLQQVSKTSRPLPAFDVVASTAFASRFTRSVPGVRRSEKCLSTDTLALVRSDTYWRHLVADDHISSTLADETTNEHRDILGTISYAKRAKDAASHPAQICINNGLIWGASCLKNGVYEFSGKNHNGLKVRWVSRRTRGTSGNQKFLSGSASQISAPRFTFSIMNPTSRRHPVIATLTRDKKLDILDRFPRVTSSTSASFPSSSLHSPASSEFSSDISYFDGRTEDDPTYIETDEALQTLIILTGIWVMSTEGWSEVFSTSSDTNNGHRQESTDGSPSTLLSSTENDVQGSPLPRQKVFRSSTSPLSQRVAPQKSGSSRRAKSTGPLTARTATMNIPHNSLGNTPLLQSAVCSDGVQLGQCESTVAMEAYKKTSTLTPGRHRDSTISWGEARPTDTRNAGQSCTETQASTLTKKSSGRGLFGRKSTEEQPEEDQTKPQLKKSAKFRAACKSLVAPCMRFP
jgi:hypothetical protein